jgi:hypothetical protein
MSRKKIPLLSKSRFLAGLQCHLRLWHQCYNRELASDVSPAQQAIFDTGNEVGRLATDLYPGGVLIEQDHLHHNEAVEATLAAIENPDLPAIFEAGFLHDGVRVRVDILERLKEGKWNLIEVKSSTSVKDVHVPDVAVQLRVLEGSGLKVQRAGILYLNNQYIYDGSRLELENLFSFSDLMEEAAELQESVGLLLSEMKDTLGSASQPDILPSRHCQSPYLCEFWEHCTAEMPDYWIMHLYGISKTDMDQLGALGVEDIRDIPGSFPLTRLQSRVRECVINREEYLSPQLADELNEVDYPIHFLDFETVAPAIPRYPGTRPYQVLSFQWSDHIVDEDGTLEHREYLCEEDNDPRGEFAETLMDALGEGGTIFVYTNYEKGIISRLAEHLPEYRLRLLATTDRFKDLHAIVKRNYYHPDFHGTFSLKSVLPALVPSMSFEKLAIQEGNHASFEYLRMLDRTTASGERKKIKNDLLTYCGHDTLGMVKIREQLLERA